MGLFLWVISIQELSMRLAEVDLWPAFWIYILLLTLQLLASKVLLN